MLNPAFGTPGSQVALVEFDSEVRLVRDFSSDQDAIETALSNLHAGDNGAAILDAIQYSVRLLEQVPRERRRVLLLISETRDHGSHFAKMAEVASQIGNSRTVIYALPFSPSLSQVFDTERGSNKDEWGATPRPAGAPAHGLARRAQKHPEGDRGDDRWRIPDIRFAEEL